MPNINLIAARREEKKRLETLTRQLFLGVAASVSVFVLLGLYLGGRRLALGGELARLDAEMLRLQPTLDSIAEKERETAALAPKVDTLEGARLSTLRWPALFQAISRTLPSGTWLSNLSSSGDAEDTYINLSGMTSSQTLVGQTMSQMQSHPIFDRTDLTFSNTTNANADEAVQRVQFEIRAHLVPVRRSEKPAQAETVPTSGQAGGEGGSIENSPANAAGGAAIGAPSARLTPGATIKDKEQVSSHVDA